MPRDARSSGLCVKWFMHEAGHPNGDAKPISTGRTVSLLASQAGEFRIEFSHSPLFEAHRTVAHVLRRSGDFVIWGPGIHHRAFGLQSCCILTLRWQPERAD